MKKYDKSALVMGVSVYVVAAALTFLLGIQKPLQTLRDMFNPVSNGYYLGIKQDYDFKPIYDDNYFDLGMITYHYDADSVGKFRPSSLWYLNMFGAGLGIMVIASGFNHSKRSR